MEHNLSDFLPYLKRLHIATVVVTGSLFLMRFVWMLRGRLAQRGPWVRTLPHYNDTLLFLSGLAMASILNLLPMRAPWLTTKLFVLLAYILLGSVALRRERRSWVGATAGVAALCCYLYIIAIAIGHDPAPSLETLLLLLRFQ
jgi:uncharacterized membrane protein SirB2